MQAKKPYAVAGTGSPVADSGDGGLPTRAELGSSVRPDIQGTLEFFGAAADSHSNVYLSDNADNLIRMVAGRSGTFFGQRMRAGDIYTIAGNGVTGFARPDNGDLATKVILGSPQGVAVDHHGNVLFGNDLGDSALRVVAVRSGTFYGIAPCALTTSTRSRAAARPSPSTASPPQRRSSSHTAWRLIRRATRWMSFSAEVWVLALSQVRHLLRPADDSRGTSMSSLATATPLATASRHSPRPCPSCSPASPPTRPATSSSLTPAFGSSPPRQARCTAST